MIADTLPSDPTAALMAIERAHEARASRRPSDLYIMGRQDWPNEKRFQLQFHKSTHVIRAMFTGNGAGKTTVAGIEADFWLNHYHPFQHTPTWPTQVIWLAPSFDQMEKLRVQIEEQCLSPGWTWNDQKHRYLWQHGACLSIASDEAEWSKLQGVPVDLVIVDEECDPKKWKELLMRRRGRRKTRFVVAATATRGKNWMYHEVYKPWLDWHVEKGLQVSEGSEDAALAVQSHPTIWCWPKGGLEDNPLSQVDRDGVHWYDEALAKASKAEKKVRLQGGFASLNTSPVFDLDNLTVMMKAAPQWQPGRVGTLEPACAHPGKPNIVNGYPLCDLCNQFTAGPQSRARRGSIKTTEAGVKIHNPLTADFDFLANGALYNGGAITIFSEPEPGEHYSIGADFGAGLENRDWDYACVLGQRSKRQVASARGRWGDISFAWVLWALGWYFNEALIVGERQFGLPCLRRLYDEWGYVNMYLQDDEQHIHARKSDLLGHHRFHGDLIIPRLQWAISPLELDKKTKLPTGKRHPPVIQFVDPILLGELERYEWRPKTASLDMADAGGRQMICGSPQGQYDDTVMGAAYAVTGWIELPRFMSKKAAIVPGSIGDKLGHGKILEGIERRERTGEPWKPVKATTANPFGGTKYPR